MKVLVLNAGSSSLKLDLYDMATEAILARGRVERIGSNASLAFETLGENVRRDAAARDHGEAIALLLSLIRSRAALLDGLVAVGHRVVHGGEKLIRPTRLDEAVEATIREASVFAPLHNPANLLGIEAARAALPDVPHLAVFDTAFHAELPEAAYLYGVPYDLYLERGVRRYGFHGPSHQFMAESASEYLRTDASRLKLVTCHLGSGASVCAIEGGRSVDVSMGMTPLEGLVMGTRSGDVDPALATLLMRSGLGAEEIDEMLNRRSGLLGISGVSADYRDVESAADAGNPRAKLATEVFVHRVRRYVGAFAAVLGGLDALVFTGGIGENSARVRGAVCDGLLFMGIALDDAANASARPKKGVEVVDIAAPRAPTRVLVVGTDEERMIAREVVRTVVGPTAVRRRVLGGVIPVGVSVRHVHLSRGDCDALFGNGYELAVRRPVTQPGQYVCRETVDLIGPKGSIERVAIINPLRRETQVELAKTDAYTLGVDPPLRESGKLDGTPGIRMRGPIGEITLKKGVILAQRHVHMSPGDAARFGVRDGTTIQVRIDGDREAVLGDVLVRVRDDFALDMHIDTDEANATALTSDSVVSFDGTQGEMRS